MDNKTLTNFGKVMVFNRAFDMVKETPDNYSHYVKDNLDNYKYDYYKYYRKELYKLSPETIRLRINLIKEEIGELNDAILQNDIIEQRDACADILYVVYGMADVLGIAIDDMFMNIIPESKQQDYIEKCITAFTISGSQYYSNFNKIKYFSSEIDEYNIGKTDSSNDTNIKLIYEKLNTIFLELQVECIKCISNVSTESNVSNENNSDTNDNYATIGNYLFELLKWTYLMTVEMGIDADADFAIVHESNMSKLCDNEIDAKATVEDYEKKHIAGISPYESPYYYYLSKLDKWIVKNLSTGKALKNIKYKKVCFV